MPDILPSKARHTPADGTHTSSPPFPPRVRPHSSRVAHTPGTQVLLSQAPVTYNLQHRREPRTITSPGGVEISEKADKIRPRAEDAFHNHIPTNTHSHGNRHTEPTYNRIPVGFRQTPHQNEPEPGVGNSMRSREHPNKLNRPLVPGVIRTTNGVSLLPYSDTCLPTLSQLLD